MMLLEDSLVDEEERRKAFREKEEMVSRLALRYRSGDRAVLGELHGELRPAIGGFLRRQLPPGRTLPPGVDPEDLWQQSYVLLAEAVLAWDAEGHGNFVPYFLRSFPWRVDRYLRTQTPSRRAAGVRMHSMPHDLLMEQVAGTVGDDGRQWEDAVVWGELLDQLPAPWAAAVRLHLEEGMPFRQVAEVLGVSRSTAHESFTRAMGRLRVLAEEGPDSEPAAPSRARRGSGLTWRGSGEIMARRAEAP